MNSKCFICMNQDQSQIIYTLQCNHKLCIKCMFKLSNDSKYNNKSKFCPFCQSRISDLELEKYSTDDLDKNIHEIINFIKCHDSMMAKILNENIHENNTFEQAILIKKFYQGVISYLEMKALNC